MGTSDLFFRHRSFDQILQNQTAKCFFVIPAINAYFQLRYVASPREILSFLIPCPVDGNTIAERIDANDFIGRCLQFSFCRKKQNADL